MARLRERASLPALDGANGDAHEGGQFPLGEVAAEPVALKLGGEALGEIQT